MEICHIPPDLRVSVVIHEIVAEEKSFITPSGYVSFIFKKPDQLTKIDEIDEKINEEAERIRNSPPVLHARDGYGVLAFYRDSFYRGLILSVYQNDAKVWFVEYGNVSVVKKTDLRKLPRELLEIPAVSILGKLDYRVDRNGFLDGGIVEKFNRKITSKDDRAADIICSRCELRPFKHYFIDIVAGEGESSFLTLMSNKSSLDWGFSFEFSPTKIESKTLKHHRTVSKDTPPLETSAPKPVAPLEEKSPDDRSRSSEKSSNRGTLTNEPDSAISTKVRGKYPPTIEGCHERIDELESRLRDLEEKMAKLCRE